MAPARSRSNWSSAPPTVPQPASAMRIVRFRGVGASTPCGRSSSRLSLITLPNGFTTHDFRSRSRSRMRCRLLRVSGSSVRRACGSWARLDGGGTASPLLRPFQRLAQDPADLLGLEEERVVAVDRADEPVLGAGGFGPGADDLGLVEEVPGDADAEERALVGAERGVDPAPIPADVVGVHGVEQRQVRVRVEAPDELLALVV